MDNSVSIIVPVFNSAPSLPELISRLETTLAGQAQAFEVILVNDGSFDDSWRVVEALASRHPWVQGINLMRNYGQHNALLCGIRFARHAIIVTMDDDLQNPPEEIPVLLQTLGEGFDVVYGAPQLEQHGLWRKLASQMTKTVLQSAMGAETARSISAFRAFRTQLRDAFSSFQGPFVSIDVLLTWSTTRFIARNVRQDERRLGSSNYTLRKLVAHAFNLMTGFSALPLEMASFAGFGFTLFGLAVLAYVVGRYFIQGTNVQGFPFLASIISIFSGVQLFALGVIGQYLARIHFRTMERPCYAVRSTTERR